MWLLLFWGAYIGLALTDSHGDEELSGIYWLAKFAALIFLQTAWSTVFDGGQLLPASQVAKQVG